MQRKKNTGKELRIRFWKLSSENEKVFTKQLNEARVWIVEGSINKMWENIAEGIKRVAKEVVSESRGSIPEKKQT